MTEVINDVAKETETENLIDFKFHWDFEKNIFEQPEEFNDFNMELDYFDEKEQEDKLWMARTGLNLDTLSGAIETIIFMSDRPVSLAKIKAQIDNEIPLRVVHEAIARLQEDYEQKHHGIRLQEVAEGFQFRTKATYSKFVQSLFKVNAIQLSPTALEVLAIIAYKQPVSRTEVERIRGVDSSHIVRGLMDKRLVKIAGRSEEVGRPSLYATTPEFLEVFNLADVASLPPEYELDEVASGKAFGKISDIKNIVSVGDKARFVFDELSELDELSKNIKDISPDTFFTKTLNAENRKKKKEEEGVRRSAFDILEEFVNNNEILTQNKQAAESETMMNALDARIVDLISEGDVLLNAPEIDEEYLQDVEQKADELGEKVQEVLNAHQLNTEELFEQMESSANEETSTEDEFETDQNMESIAQMVQELAEENLDSEDKAIVDELFGNEEEQALEAALDDAFENLMGESLNFNSEELEEMSASEEEALEKELDELDELSAQVVEKAKEMDLDLKFLDQGSDEA